MQTAMNALMQVAMKNMVKELLEEVAKDGLPGNHHFFIAFRTAHPGVDIAPWLKEKYPDEMTIVMQDWFDNLAVMSDRFTVTLNFNNTAEPMVIPFDAITSFSDPSVEFGLRFDATEPKNDKKLEEVSTEVEEPHRDAEVVSLAAFRKPKK
ncbi:MAG: hypothetical protein JKY31_00495 [Rhodobacteraceae bacterium]|nr:hypothetical protein [Paracoccaceae bacterium]